MTGQLLEPVEEFQLENVAGGTILTPRAYACRLMVEPNLVNRVIWIALEPVRIIGPTYIWKTTGELRFIHDGRIVGRMPVNLSNYSQVLTPPTFKHCGDSQMPTLRWEFDEGATAFRKHADFPPFYFRIKCNEIALWVDTLANGAADQMYFLKGLRILSQ